MSVHSTPPRLVRTALMWALVVFLGTGTFAIFGAQEPDPDAPATSARGDAPTGIGANPAAQPIAFSHAQHVTAVGVDCQFCHAYARRGPVAGIPSVQRCVGCHRVVLNEQPEILKVLEYWENAEPIPWIRVHDLPDYVRFAHKPHIRAGVDCADCHGQVEKMHAAVQVESLSMGWCLSCHQERDVTRDCLACHY
ncbi:MAG: cytochrome c family protein [Vicinamibacterales bacterium]|nr:cytochrome c family protein [Vicinamibacterales bacterium]HIM50486.1 menaquinol oxidoreductase [Acidobacteriota bacterium]